MRRSEPKRGFHSEDAAVPKAEREGPAVQGEGRGRREVRSVGAGVRVDMLGRGRVPGSAATLKFLPSPIWFRRRERFRLRKCFILEVSSEYF